MRANPRPDKSMRPALEALAARDPDIARHYRVIGLPPPRRRAPGFSGLLHIIVAQQVSAQASAAIIARLDAAARPLTPERFLGLDEPALKAIGFSRQKMGYGRALAEDLLSGRIDLMAVAEMADDAAIAHLIRAKGVGRWSAEIYLLFTLGRPDIWPADDLAVQAATARLKGLSARPTRADMLEIGASWRPYRSAAARFLWHLYRHPGVADGTG